MPNRQLSAVELSKANELLTVIRAKLTKLSRGDGRLLFAYRRKIYKELSYDERGKPMHRRKLKAQKFAQQGGKCALCQHPLPATDSVLDRLDAATGYTHANTRLLCPGCDKETQSDRGYA